jgi:hypothetical protein
MYRLKDFGHQHCIILMIYHIIIRKRMLLICSFILLLNIFSSLVFRMYILNFESHWKNKTFKYDVWSIFLILSNHCQIVVWYNLYQIYQILDIQVWNMFIYLICWNSFLDVTVHSNSVFPFEGGESVGLAHLNNYIWVKNLVKSYKQTRNSLIGPENTTKFSAWFDDISFKS